MVDGEMKVECEFEYYMPIVLQWWLKKKKNHITDCFCFMFTGLGNLERRASPTEKNLPVNKLKIHKTK